MTTIATARPTIPPAPKYLVDDAQLAAAAFLARYSGRTLDAYRLDLRGTSSGPPTTRFRCRTRLAPTSSCTAPGWTNAAWPASTIDRRLWTVCGFYRFAHIDGRIGSNPAQYVRRARVHPSDVRGLGRSELGVFRFTGEQHDRDHAAFAVLLGLIGLRVSEACATNVEDLGLQRGHRTLRILGKRTKCTPSSRRSARPPVRKRSGPSLSGTVGVCSCLRETSRIRR
jgi:integrase/recombinase XerD